MVLVIIGIKMFAQDGNDTLVQKNKQKIAALMKELESLEKKEKSSKTPYDCEKQTLLLSNQITELQEQLKNNQTEVQRLTTLLSDLMKKDQEARIGNNSGSLNNIESGGSVVEKAGSSCYVVLKSFRKQPEADEWMKHKKLTETAIKHNSKKTWFHVVMEQPLPAVDAGKAVYKQRQNGFADAWWKEIEYFE